MEEDTSSSKAIRMTARREVLEETSSAYANSSRWIDQEEYERLANIAAIEKEEEFRASQPTLQLFKPKSKAWNTPIKIPLHMRKQANIPIPDSIKKLTPVPPNQSITNSPRQTGHRTIKLRESIDKREKKENQEKNPASIDQLYSPSNMEAMRESNKDLYSSLVQRFRHKDKSTSPSKIGQLKQIQSIEDAVLYFLCEKHRKNVLYFQPEKQLPNQTYRPYDLKHVGAISQAKKEEHYIMSANRLIHYKANENMECISIAEWVYHSHMFDHLLTGIPLFQQLLCRRIFSTWSMNVRMRLYREIRGRLCSTLHTARPVFCRALKELHMASSMIRTACVLGAPGSAIAKSMSLNEWNQLQESRGRELENQLTEAKAAVHLAVYGLVQTIRENCAPNILLEQLDNTDMYKMRQAYPEWKSIPIGALKQFKKENAAQVETANHDFMLLPSLFSLIQYVFTESLHLMVLRSTAHLHRQFTTQLCGSITVAVSFLIHDTGGMVLDPTEEDMLHHTMESLSRLIALSNSYSSERKLKDYLTPEEMKRMPSTSSAPFSGMRLVDLLKIDEGFHDEVQQIRWTIKLAFNKIATQVKTFEILRPIYSSIHDENQTLPTIESLTKFMTDMPSLLKLIQNRISKLDNWQHLCHKTQASWTISFLEIHCRHIISSLLEKISTQRLLAHQLLNDLTSRGIAQCVTSLKDAIIVLDERPQMTEAFCEQKKVVRNVVENEKQLFLDIKMVEEAFKSLRANCPASASDSVGQFNLIHALLAKYTLSFQANQKFCKKMLPHISQQVIQALQKYTAHCKRIISALEANVTVRNPQTFTTGKSDYESKLNPLNGANSIPLLSSSLDVEFKAELDSITTSASVYHEYQKIMGIKITPVVLLEVARGLWHEVHDVWTLCQQWRMTHAMMHAHKFIVQSWSKNQETTREFLLRAEALKCRFENKIFIGVKAELHTFSKQLDLAVELGASYIKASHWEQIFKILGGDMNVQSFTLKQLHHLDMWAHVDKIRNITYHARIDAETEVQLQAMKARWASTELICKGFELDLTHVDELLSILDDDLVQVQHFMQRTSQPSLYKDLSLWSEEINYIQDTLELWVYGQSDWQKLDRIFQLPDIQQSVRHANVEFQMLSRKWKSMMKGVRTTTSVQYCVREVTNRTFLTDAKALFERLWKQLVLFLQEKRREFPRYNFVSDRELLVIMAGTTLNLNQQCEVNASQLAAVITKCFENIHRISLEIVQVDYHTPAIPEGNPTTPQFSKPTTPLVNIRNHAMSESQEDLQEISYSTEIVAVHGNHNETLVFSTSVKVTQRPEGWMKEMAKTVQRGMKDGLKQLMNDFSDLSLFYGGDRPRDSTFNAWFYDIVEKWPLQLLLLAVRINFTTDCNRWIQEQSDPGQILNQIKQRANECIQCMRLYTDVKYCHAFSTLAICFLNCSNTIQRIMESRQKEFEWSQLLQYQWKNETQTCVVSHGVKTFDYGYEYMGPHSTIALTPLTERMMWNMSMAFRLHSGALVYGETGVSKQAAIRELILSIGALCVVYDCSIQFNIQQLTRILGGIVQCQAYVSVVGLEHVNTDKFGHFVHQVKRLQHALKTHKEKLLIESTLVPLHSNHTTQHNYGVFCKLTVDSETGAKPMLQQCASAFVAIACQFHLPDAAWLIQLYFTCIGFQNVTRLTKDLHSFLILLGTTYAPSPGEYLSMRIVKKIVDLAARYFDMYHDEEQVVAHAVWNSIGSRITPDRKRNFLALLHRHFPAFHHIDLDISKTNQHIHDQMELRNLVHTPLGTRKVAELHHLCSTYAINVITGDTSSGKSTAIELLSGLKRHAEGDQRAKCFRIAVASLKVEEFYGHFSLHQNEWFDGIITHYIRQRTSEMSRKQNAYIPWLVFDGDMSNACVEPLYSISDDRSQVRLPNGEFLNMRQIRIFFETSSLEQWSPSALSRFGIIYMPSDSLPYTIYIKSWLLRSQRATPPLDERILAMINHCAQLMRSQLPSLIDVCRNHCHSGFKFDPPTMVSKFVSLLQHFVDKLHATSPSLKSDGTIVYLCACTWSLGSVIQPSSQAHFHSILMKIAPELKCHKLFTHGRTMYDVYWRLEGQSVLLSSWSSRLHQVEWSSLVSHNHIMIPNEATIFIEHMVTQYAMDKTNALILGGRGVGKSCSVRRALNTLSDRNSIRTIFIDKAIQAADLQEQVLSDLERKMKGLFGPISGKHGAVYHLEDLHLSQHECHEQLRQMIDMHGIYNRTTYERIELSSTIYIGVSTNENNLLKLSHRFLRHFNLIWNPELTPDMLFQMFKTLPIYIETHYQVLFPLDICWKALQYPILLLQASWGHIYHSFHSIFTIGDIIQIYSSILKASKIHFETKFKLEGLILNLTACCFESKMKLSNENKNSFKELTKTILSTLEFDIHDENYIYHYANKGDGTGYVSLSYKIAQNLFLTGDEKFQWHHPTFKDIVVKNLVPFPQAMNSLLHVLACISDMKLHSIFSGPRGCGKRTTAILASGILSYKYIEIRQPVHILKELKNALLYIGTTANNMLIYIVMDELSNNLRRLVAHIIRDGDIPWSMYDIHELDEMTESMKQLPSMQHMNPSKLQCYSLYKENLKRHLHLVVSILDNNCILDEMVEYHTSMIHSCNFHIFEPWNRDCFNFIIEKMGVPPILTRIFQNIHESFLQKRIQIQRLGYINPSNAFKRFLNHWIQLSNELQKKIDLIRLNYSSGLKYMKIHIKEINELNLKEKKLLKEIKILSNKGDEYQKRYTRQKIVEENLHKEYTKEDEGYQNMKSTIDEDRRRLQNELDQAVPELQAAIVALNKINKLHITEMKSFTSPPELVRLVMQAVCVLLGLGASPTWEDALFVLCDMRFLDRLKTFDKDNVQENVMKRLEKYIQHPKFNEEEMKRASIASTSLCRWVLAMVRYHTVMTYVRPKQAKLDTAHAQMERLQYKVSAAMDAWKMCESKSIALQRAMTENENKKVILQKDLHEIRERTQAVDRVSVVFENLKPLLRQELHELKNAEECLTGDCIMVAATSVYISVLKPSHRQPILNEWLTLCKESSIPVSINWLETTLGKENMQELHANCPLLDIGILTNLHLLHRWRHSPPYQKYPFIIDPAGIATSWIKTTERHSFEIVSANDPMIISRFEISMPNLNIVLVIDRIAQCEENIFWDLFHLLESHGQKRPIYFLADTDCLNSFSPRFLECFDLISFEIESKDVEEVIVDIFSNQFLTSQETELHALNERLLDDMKHRTIFIQQLLRQIVLSQRNLLSCEDDMVSLMNRMTSLTQILGGIEIKRNAIAHHLNNRQMYQIIGQRGEILLKAGNNFGVNFYHKLIDTLKYSMKKLSNDIIFKTPNEICDDITASFLEEALHSLQRNLHLGFLFYISLNICEKNQKELILICKKQIKLFSSHLFPGLHIKNDIYSPTITHLIATKVIQQAIEITFNKIILPKLKKKKTIQMNDILRDNTIIHISSNGIKRSFEIQNLLIKWKQLFQMKSFSGLIHDIDLNQIIYEKYINSNPRSLHDIPKTIYTTKFSMIEKFAMISLSHNSITQSMLFEIVSTILPNVKFPSLSILDMVTNTDGHRPIALHYNPETIVDPLWCLIEAAQRIGISEENVFYYSLATKDGVTLALKSIKECTFHGGWIILQDLNDLNSIEKRELTKQFEMILFNDLNIHSEFRIWLLFNSNKKIFFNWNIKKYNFTILSKIIPENLKNSNGILHNKYKNGLILFHFIILFNSFHYFNIFSFYELEQVDFLLRCLYDEKEIGSGIQADKWTSKQIASVIVSIYNSKINDEIFKKQINILYQWLLEFVADSIDFNDMNWNNSLKNALKILNEENKNYFSTDIPQISNQLWIDASILGLPSCMDCYFDWEIVESILSHLSLLDSTPLGFISPHVLVDTIMFQIPKDFTFQHAARKAWHSPPTQLDQIMYCEMISFEKYLIDIWNHLRLMYHEKELSISLQYGFIANWMIGSYAMPLRLLDWISWIQASVSMYQEWIWRLKSPIFRLQAFQNPKALLITILESYAIASGIPICDLCLGVSKPNRSNSLDSIQIAHLYFRNAKWDGNQLSPLDDKDGLIQRSSPLTVYAWHRDQAQEAMYSCPIYTYYYTHVSSTAWKLHIPSTIIDRIYLPYKKTTSPSFFHAKGVVCVLNEAFH